MLFVCLGIVLSDFAEAQRMNLLSGGKVIASGYEGMPVYIFEGDYDTAYHKMVNCRTSRMLAFCAIGR